MPYSSRSYLNRNVPSNRFPVGLKWLLIANVGIFVLSAILQHSNAYMVFERLALIPADLTHPPYAIWELVTYMFLHAGISHIVWNMLSLWMFGAALEQVWGTTRFLRFYFACGIFAGITVVLCAYLFRGAGIPTVGSSGAIYGILVAYGLLFPDTTILFGFLIPIKSKYFVMIIGGIVLLQSWMSAAGGPGSGIAVAAHLGGLVAGYLLLRGRRLHVQVREPLVANYKEWKLRRAKKKFEVYLKKRDSSRGPWVH